MHSTWSVWIHCSSCCPYRCSSQLLPASHNCILLSCRENGRSWWYASPFVSSTYQKYYTWTQNFHYWAKCTSLVQIWALYLYFAVPSMHVSSWKHYCRTISSKKSHHRSCYRTGDLMDGYMAWHQLWLVSNVWRVNDLLEPPLLHLDNQPKVHWKYCQTEVVSCVGDR